MVLICYNPFLKLTCMLFQCLCSSSPPPDVAQLCLGRFSGNIWPQQEQFVYFSLFLSESLFFHLTSTFLILYGRQFFFPFFCSALDLGLEVLQQQSPLENYRLVIFVAAFVFPRYFTFSFLLQSLWHHSHFGVITPLIHSHFLLCLLWWKESFFSLSLSPCPLPDSIFSSPAQLNLFLWEQNDLFILRISQVRQDTIVNYWLEPAFSREEREIWKVAAEVRWRLHVAESQKAAAPYFCLFSVSQFSLVALFNEHLCNYRPKSVCFSQTSLLSFQSDFFTSFSFLEFKIKYKGSNSWVSSLLYLDWFPHHLQ